MHLKCNHLRWKDASPIEKRKYIKFSEEDKKRYEKEVEEISEGLSPLQRIQKCKMLKNALELEKSVDELVQKPLETVNDTTNQLKAQRNFNPLDSSQVLDDVSKSIETALERLNAESKEQGTHPPNLSKVKRILFAFPNFKLTFRGYKRRTHVIK